MGKLTVNGVTGLVLDVVTLIANTKQFKNLEAFL